MSPAERERRHAASNYGGVRTLGQSRWRTPCVIHAWGVERHHERRIKAQVVEGICADTGPQADSLTGTGHRLGATDATCSSAARSPP